MKTDHLQHIAQDEENCLCDTSDDFTMLPDVSTEPTEVDAASHPQS